jgi:thiol-disulfide isomerase/thioredoxin
VPARSDTRSPRPGPFDWAAAKARVLRYLPYALALAAFYYVMRPAPSGPSVGAAASDFDLPVVANLPEGRFRLADQRGKPVLIEVFASWCPSCRSMAGTLSDVSATRRAREVSYVAVSVDDDPEAARDVAAAWRVPYAVAHDDGSVSRQYSIRSLPTLILVDEAGMVREVAAGGVSRSKLERWLSEVGAPALE